MATKAQTAGKRSRKSTSQKRAATTDILAVMCLDMSGSMGSVRPGVIEGVNEYLTGLKQDMQDGKGTTLFSLTAFDTVFEHWHVGDEVLDIPLLDSPQEQGVRPSYIPRGGTALYDAIANSVTETQAKLVADGHEDMKVLHITVTDGQENSSQEYGAPDGRGRLAALIKAYEAKGNWTFVYLGADHADLATAQAYASSVGYSPDNAMLAAMSSPKATSASFSNLADVHSTRQASPMSSTPSAFADAGQSAADYSDAGGTVAPKKVTRGKGKK